MAAYSVGARGVETYIPRLTQHRRRGSNSPPAFPGYLFARVEPRTDDLLRIRSVPGIAYVLPRDGPPAYVPEQVIRLLREREAAPLRPLERGERVLLLMEPFRSLEAVFDRRLKAAGRVRVLLEVVHRIIALNVPEAQLRRARG